MAVQLTRLDPAGADRSSLISFMTGNSFPFHVGSALSEADVSERIAGGAFRDDETESFWVEHPDLGRIGVVRLEDLQDDTPLFDLRLADAFRGRGLARPVLTAITDHVFTTLPAVTRFEGQTREDNVAMRKTFLRCGWVKEAHFREAWPVSGGTPLASVAYAILRRDWETGTTTTFEWNDVTL